MPKMKRNIWGTVTLVLAVAHALSPILSSAQALRVDVPDTLSVQGILTDSAGLPINGPVDLTFVLRKSGIGVWAKSLASVPVTDGRFNALLGGLNLDSVSFGVPMRMGVEVEADGEMIPRISLAAVPYAFAVRGFSATRHALTHLDGLFRDGMAIVAGASNNRVDFGVAGATVSGGGGKLGEHEIPNYAGGFWSTIGGGASNEATGQFSTISGGGSNDASSLYSTVSGGFSNIASADYATVAGGNQNNAVQFGAGIVAGLGNTASGAWSAVVSGDANTAAGYASIVGGGQNNEANGKFATVPGGIDNDASGYGSFAAGVSAEALHGRSFVFSGIQTATASTDSSQFLIDVANGVGIGTNSPGGELEVSNAERTDVIISSERSAILTLKADTDNSDEFDNPAIEMRQDGGTVGMDLGFFESGAGNTFFIWPSWNGLPGGNPGVSVRADNGYVGIGTTNPTNRFHSWGLIDGFATNIADHVAFIENNSPTTANGPDVLAVRSSTPGGTMSASTNFITFFEGGGSAVGAIEGITGPGISLNTSGADYAEFIPKRNPSDPFGPGDVIGIFADGASHETAGALRVMVVSESPAVVGNRPIGIDEDQFDKTHVKAAFVGQVPVRVDGAAGSGDYLVASRFADGLAVAVAPDKIRRTDLERLVGRVWSVSAAEEIDMVVAEVGLDKTSVLSHIVEIQDQRLGVLEEMMAEQALLIAELKRHIVSDDHQMPRASR